MQAVAVMLEKYEVCCGLFYGFDWSKLGFQRHTSRNGWVCCPPPKNISWRKKTGKIAV